MDKSRNLSDKCKDCPYKDVWGLYDCVNNALPYLVDRGIYGKSCSVPWDELKSIERIRNFEEILWPEEVEENVDQT